METRLAGPLATLAPTPATHLRLWLYAAVLRLAAHLDSVGGPELIDARFPFMAIYLDDARGFLRADDGVADLESRWWRVVGDWERAWATPRWPLPRLREAGLTPAHLLALALTGLVEVDARFGVVFAALQPIPDEQRPTIGLLDELLRAAPVPCPGWEAAHQLAQAGIVQLHRPEQPRAARTLGLPDPIWDACGGSRAAQPAPGLAFAEPDAAPSVTGLRDLLPAAPLARLARLPALLRDGALRGVIVRGMRGSGRRRALGALARELGLGTLTIARPEPPRLAELCRLAGPLATLLGAMPVIDLEPGPGEFVPLPPLAGHAGPLGIALGAEGGVQGDRVEASVTLHLPPADQELRRATWLRALGPGADPAFADEAGRTFHLTVGGIEHAAALARSYATLDSRDAPTLADAREACRALNRQSVEGLATPVTTEGYSWATLVVPDATRAELALLLQRCRGRETVLGALGPGFGQTNRGVRALFTGPSGVGKTLAARIVAAELGLDLYRVDLASIVNKYIGETERNLSRLFARAEEQDIVLLLDEGDALLTGRTDVRSSNDRYANLETNYLLQRLESYEGILLVTTNAANRVDGAFQRRMDSVVEFAAPGAAQRLAIWQLHLPPEHAIPPAYLRTLATRCALSGGQIRNAVIHAATLAIERAGPVDRGCVVEAVGREYRKLGATSPLAYE